MIAGRRRHQRQPGLWALRVTWRGQRHGEIVLRAMSRAPRITVCDWSRRRPHEVFAGDGAVHGRPARRRRFPTALLTGGDQARRRQHDGAATAKRWYERANVDTTNGIVPAMKTTSTGAERLSINTAHDGYTGIVVKSNSTSQSGYFALFKTAQTGGDCLDYGSRNVASERIDYCY